MPMTLFVFRANKSQIQGFFHDTIWLKIVPITYGFISKLVASHDMFSHLPTCMTRILTTSYFKAAFAATIEVNTQ